MMKPNAEMIAAGAAVLTMYDTAEPKDGVVPPTVDAVAEHQTDSGATAKLNHTLVDYQGKNIVVVFVDPADYNADPKDAVIEPDEPPLPMDGAVHAAQAVDTVKAGEVEAPLVEPDAPTAAADNDPAPVNTKAKAGAKAAVH